MDKSEENMSGVLEMQSTTELALSFKDVDQDLIEPCGGPLGNLMLIIRAFAYRLFNVAPDTISKFKVLAFIGVLITYLLYVLARWYKSKCPEADWSDGYGFLLILVVLVLSYLLYRHGVTRILRAASSNLNSTQLHKMKKGIKWSYYVFLGVVVMLFLILSIHDALDEPRRLLSLGGYLSILSIAFIFSKHPNYVRWDIIARGVSLHIFMGLILVRWSSGREVLSIFSEKVISFLEFAYIGARFVYGDLLLDLGVFYFKVLSVLFFLAMVINILFYYGILQAMFKNLGHMMQLLVGTTIIESSNAVASIFLGMSEAPLLFQPYLIELTNSEIHSLMTSGFATVAGTVLAAYVSFGADPAMLISASAMAAPAALTTAKLFYPENRKSKTSINNLVLHKSNDSNAVDAACKGAMLGCELVPAIAANVLSFVSLVACFNTILSWLGELAGIPDFTFERVVGLVFVPLAWLMGVSSSEVVDVARLIGVKTVINEFVGYKKLGELKIANKISARSQAIATYAMCGFANPGAVAIMVSSLVTVCPEKRETITQIALRAFVAGSCASFLSASLAGFLTPENGFPLELESNNYSNATDNKSCYFYSW